MRPPKIPCFCLLTVFVVNKRFSLSDVDPKIARSRTWLMLHMWMAFVQRTFVGLDAEEDVQVSVLAAAAPGVALAAHAQPAAIVHTRRDAQVYLRQQPPADGLSLTRDGLQHPTLMGCLKMQASSGTLRTRHLAADIDTQVHAKCCSSDRPSRSAQLAASTAHLLALPNPPVAAARVARRALLPGASALVTLRDLPRTACGRVNLMG